MENQKNKKNKLKILILIVVNILLIAGITGGMYYYFNTIKKEDIKTENKETIEEDTTKEVEENSSLNIPSNNELETLISNYELPEMPGRSFIYSGNNVTTQNIDRRLIEEITLAFMGLDTHGLDWELEGKTFTLEEYKANITKLFGKDVAESYQPDNIAARYPRVDDFVYIYNPNTKIYSYQILEGGGGGIYYPFQVRKIINSKIDGNQLKVEVAVGQGDYYESEQNKTTGEYIPKYRAIDPYTVNYPIENFDLERDYDKLTKFTYTFDYDQEIGYYFNNIIRN